MNRRRRRRRPVEVLPSGFAGFRFPAQVILLAVRWYLRYGLSYRDLEGLMAERGVEVDPVTLYRSFVDETYAKISGITSTGPSTSSGRSDSVVGTARRDASAARDDRSRRTVRAAAWPTTLAWRSGELTPGPPGWRPAVSGPSLPHRRVRGSKGMLIAAVSVANTTTAERRGVSRWTARGSSTTASTMSASQVRPAG
jgi:hypothetical protein